MGFLKHQVQNGFQKPRKYKVIWGNFEEVFQWHQAVKSVCSETLNEDNLSGFLES